MVHPPVQAESRYPYFMDYLRVYLLHVKGYSPEMIYEGGLRIEVVSEGREAVAVCMVAPFSS